MDFKLSSGEAACTVGDSSTSDDGVCTLPYEPTIRMTKHFAQSAMTAARSTLHGAALAIIGMGEEQKLRCASIFASPMALSTAGVGEDGTLVAEMAKRRTTVCSRAIERQSPRTSLPTVSEESGSNDGFSQEQHRHPKPVPGSSPGGQHVQACWVQRSKMQQKANARAPEHHHDNNECSALGHQIDRPSARNHQAAVKPMPSKSAQDIVSDAGSASVSREDAQLSTIQVVPEAVCTLQASLSVSQIDLVCRPPSHINHIHGPQSIARKLNDNGTGQGHCVTHGDAGHAKHDCNAHYAFSADSSSSPYDMQAGTQPLQGHLFGNPMAHESELRKAVVDRTMERAADQMQVGMDVVPAHTPHNYEERNGALGGRTPNPWMSGAEVRCHMSPNAPPPSRPHQGYTLHTTGMTAAYNTGQEVQARSHPPQANVISTPVVSPPWLAATPWEQHPIVSAVTR